MWFRVSTFMRREERLIDTCDAGMDLQGCYRPAAI
jgi:hypothetical protein